MKLDLKDYLLRFEIDSDMLTADISPRFSLLVPTWELMRLPFLEPQGILSLLLLLVLGLGVAFMISMKS